MYSLSVDHCSPPHRRLLRRGGVGKSPLPKFGPSPQVSHPDTFAGRMIRRQLLPLVVVRFAVVAELLGTSDYYDLC